METESLYQKNYLLYFFLFFNFWTDIWRVTSPLEQCFYAFSSVPSVLASGPSIKNWCDYKNVWFTNYWLNGTQSNIFPSSNVTICSFQIVIRIDNLISGCLISHLIYLFWLNHRESSHHVFLTFDYSTSLKLRIYRGDRHPTLYFFSY